MSKITSVIIGSIRPGRHSERVANFIKKHLVKKGHTVHMIDPIEHEDLLTLKIPFHHNSNPSEDMKNIHNVLLESDGFILVTPEYNHSFSGTIKNVLDNFMPEYEKKPFGIVSYSSGPFGGIRANEALRPVISELKGVPTPIPFMISNVNNVFDENGELKDEKYDERIIPFIENYDWYLNALKNAREKK